MWAKIKRWFYKLIGRKSKVDEVFGLEVFDGNGAKTFSSDTGVLRVMDILQMNGSDISKIITKAPPPYTLIVIGGSGGINQAAVIASQSGTTVSARYVQPRQNVLPKNPAKILVCR